MQLVELLVCNRKDLVELISMEHFTQLLDLILEERLRAKCSEIVLSAFVSEHRAGSCDNFRVAYQVRFLHVPCPIRGSYIFYFTGQL